MYLALIVLSAVLLVALAAWWAARGRGDWFVRCLPLVLLLAATAPIGAYELAVTFGTQATVIVAGLSLVRRLTLANGSPGDPTGARASSIAQFSLVDLLKAVLLAAILFAILRNAVPETSHVWDRGNILGFVASGVVLGLVSLAVIGLLKLLWRYGPSGLKRPIVVALAAVAIGAFGFLGYEYRWLLPPPIPESADTSIPDITEEVVKASTSVNWTAIPNQDVSAASELACKTFLSDNEALLKRVSLMARAPSRMRVEYTQAFIGQMSGIQEVRSLYRAQMAAAKALIADGRVADAAQYYLDMARLGIATSNGGFVINDLIASVAPRIVATDSNFANSIHVLSADEAIALAKEMEVIDASRDAWEAFERRERTFAALSLGWVGRLLERSTKVFGVDQTIERTKKSHRLSQAQWRLLATMLAIHAYQLREGSLPRRIEQLAPDYLNGMPIDPFSGQPFVYRLTDDGYHLYSVGADGKDDGGLAIDLRQFTDGVPGDVFVDINDPPQPVSVGGASPDDEPDEDDEADES